MLDKGWIVFIFEGKDYTSYLFEDRSEAEEFQYNYVEEQTRGQTASSKRNFSRSQFKVYRFEVDETLTTKSRKGKIN